jgi:hypothetical protein
MTRRGSNSSNGKLLPASSILYSATPYSRKSSHKILVIFQFSIPLFFLLVRDIRNCFPNRQGQGGLEDFELLYAVWPMVVGSGSTY